MFFEHREHFHPVDRESPSIWKCAFDETVMKAAKFGGIEEHFHFTGIVFCDFVRLPEALEDFLLGAAEHQTVARSTTAPLQLVGCSGPETLHRLLRLEADNILSPVRTSRRVQRSGWDGDQITRPCC